MEKRRNQIKKVEEADWSQYFFKIRQWCPWSYQAYQRGRIEFRQYQGTFDIAIGDYEARVWLVSRKPRLLKKWHKILNHSDKECEWLWSHPYYGANSTPYPCLIQQPRARLEALRSKINMDQR